MINSFPTRQLTCVWTKKNPSCIIIFSVAKTNSLEKPAPIRPQPCRPQPVYAPPGKTSGWATSQLIEFLCFYFLDEIIGVSGVFTCLCIDRWDPRWSSRLRNFPVELEVPSIPRVSSFDHVPDRKDHANTNTWRSGSQVCTNQSNVYVRWMIIVAKGRDDVVCWMNYPLTRFRNLTKIREASYPRMLYDHRRPPFKASQASWIAATWGGLWGRLVTVIFNVARFNSR